MDSTVTTNTLSRYWKLWRINAAGNIGYKQITVRVAQEFATAQVSNIENSNIQKILFSYFKGGKYKINNPMNSARAGLCLRCYVSESILKECKKIYSLFSGEKQFTYRDLLPFVLDDDGQKLIILAPDGKTQLMVDDNCQTKESKYNLFTVTVLQTFNPDLQSRMSLDNWAYLQTKQNSELKKFLSEFGFSRLSDWAMLNRVRKKQLERLSPQERYVVEAFHAVYRRDRQKQQIRRAKKCPDPTDAQLQEMLVYLQQRQSCITTPVELIQQFKQIIKQLRTYDIWNSRESLDMYDVESGTYVPRGDLPSESLDEVDIEDEDFSQFLGQNLDSSLTEIIKQEVEAAIQKLKKSRRYSSFASKYIKGLQLYYTQAMSFKEITPELGMQSWNQTRRILNPGELLSRVRVKTIETMLEIILREAAKKGLTEIPPKADYLKNIAEQIESYVDEEIFQAAAEEIRAVKNRTMNSIYAQQLRSYIQEFI